jgi:hypothetical protein
MSTVDVGGSPLPSLGNLGHAARHNKLKRARSILIWLGALMVLVNGALLLTAEQQVHQQINKEVAELTKQGLTIDQSKLAVLEAAAVRTAQLFIGGVALVGALFIVFGINIYRFPVPITILSLVLYLGVVAINGVADPNTIWQGIIVKIIVIAGLVSAVRAALAYEQEGPVVAAESAG